MFLKQKAQKKTSRLYNMKIKLNGKLYPADSVKYLGAKIDSKLNWKSHVNATVAN